MSMEKTEFILPYRFFVDGSYEGNGKGGIGGYLIDPCGEELLCFSLKCDEFTSPTDVELSAVRKAFYLFNIGGFAGDLVVVSDCKVLLPVGEYPKPIPKENLRKADKGLISSIRSIQDELLSKDINFYLEHYGDRSKAKADRLSKGYMLHRRAKQRRKTTLAPAASPPAKAASLLVCNWKFAFLITHDTIYNTLIYLTQLGKS